MIRSQRRLHAIVWAIGLPALAVGLFLLIKARPTDAFVPPESTPVPSAAADQEPAP